LIVIAGLVASAGARSTLQAPRGLVIEVFQKGSAVEQAGGQIGDVLISWTRSAPSSSVPVAQGEFRSPFDAREFEIEQLPRGGTSITVVRQGQSIAKPLTPGLWGVSVRPAFAPAELAIYTAGAAVNKEKPAEALNAWQPLIDRSVQAGDVETAAHLLTCVAAAMVGQGQVEPGDELFERAAGLFKTPPNPLREATVWETKGEAYFSDVNPALIGGAERRVDRRTFQVAIASHERARQLRAQRAPGTLAEAESQILGGKVRVAALQFVNTTIGLPVTSADERREFIQVGERIQTALASVVDQASGSLLHARALLVRGSFVVHDFKEQSGSAVTRDQARASGETFYQQARPIFEAVSPKHPLMLFTLRSLQIPANPQAALALNRQRAELELVLGATNFDVRGLPSAEAETLLRRRLALATASANLASARNASLALAQALMARGAWDEAILVLEEAKRSGDTSAQLVRTLASGYAERGDLAAAEQVVLSRLGAGEVSLNDELNLVQTLAGIAWRRGDFSGAETMYGRALDISEQRARAEYERQKKYWAERTGPLSAGEAARKVSEAHPDYFRRFHGNLYQSLSSLASLRGDREQATKLLLRAAEVDSFASVNAPAMRSDLLQRQHHVALMKGDSATAAQVALEILSEVRRDAPGSIADAVATERVGLDHADRKAFDKAASSLRDALAIRERLQPRSEALATTLHWLGHIEQQGGDRRAALTHFEAALDVIDDRRMQRRSDALLSWNAPPDTLLGVANDIVGLLLVDGRQERAFNVLERSRGRGLLDMLATRGLRDPNSIPQDLRDERRRLETEYDRIQARLESIAPANNASAVNGDLVRLRETRLQLDDLDRRVAKLDPRRASVNQPVPTTLTEVRSRLDSGTVLLSYLMGPGSIYLFVVTAPAAGDSAGSGIATYTIPNDRNDVRPVIAAFRRLIDVDTNPAIANRAELMKRGRDLYDRLVRPAEAQIAGAKRVLLSLDGPLHALPFGALVRQQGGKSQFFVEWKALHTTPSMSVYAETLKARRAADPSGVVVALGDPSYPQDTASADAEVQFLTRRGLNLKPLPGTRQEVGAIRQLFGSRAVTYLGEAATEARAKTIGTSARYIHLAVHGVFSDQLPLNSALAFTMPKSPAPGEDNGLLQAWEIFEQMRIDADLVTLSACDSGLGKEIAGEGLMGLTRAFLYAGARTVNASLWKVADGPTAELMTLLYRNLKAGQTKDEALRNAQVALIKKAPPKGSSVDYASPAHWAAFTLTGDWK
jgi:CHAT domain-containing protein/tetratricopeptide (TPR) repeat protein